MLEKGVTNPGLNPSLKTDLDNGKIPSLPLNLTEPNGNNSNLSAMEISKSIKASNENDNFTIKISKKFQISVCKPLIPLKFAQFCYFGGGSYMVPFLTIFLKQRGVSLSQLSWMNIITPIVQLCGTALTGIIADKTGKSKPVLVANLLLVTSAIIGILLMPTLKRTSCRDEESTFSCSDFNPSSTFTEERHCREILENCNLQCLDSSAYNDKNQSTIYNVENNKHKSLPVNISLHTKNNESCFFETESTPIISFIEICSQPDIKTCHLICPVTLCQTETDSWSWLFIGYIVLYVIFFTTFSNVYRCFDITAVALVKEHNSDFGRERFFAICGNLMISPLAGYIANATTTKEGDKNYAAGFYLFIFMVFLVLLFLYKIPVQVKSPGKKMGRRSIGLFKNPDIISLILVVLILGTAWNFTKIYVFWFLADLNAPSMLIGLIPSVSALYGLPFLLTSNWWVAKIGCTNVIVLAFLSYVLTCMGFSFLTNPWYALLLEVFGSIAYYLLWVAVVVHSNELAPDGMSATVVGVAGALHFSIGKATGGMVGEFVMTAFGDREAFRFIAIVCLISAILYALYLYLKRLYSSKEFQLKHSSKNEEYKKEPSCIFVLEKPI